MHASGPRCYVVNFRARSGKLGECRLFNVKCCKNGNVIQLPRRMILLNLHLDQVLEYRRDLSAGISIHIHGGSSIDDRCGCIAYNIDMRVGRRILLQTKYQGVKGYELLDDESRDTC